MLTIFLYYLVKLLHLAIAFLVIVGPFVIKNIFWLLLIIVINIIIVSGWYLYGYCFCTDIENMLDGSNSIKTNKSFITELTENNISLNKKQIHIFMSIIPLLSSIVCVVNIYLYKCRK